MTKIQIVNEWVKLIVAATLVFVLVCMGLVLIHANQSMTKLDAAVDNINTEIKALDITRKSADDLMVQTTVLITDADNAATEEQASLKAFSEQLTSTLSGVDNAVAALTAESGGISAQTVQTLAATTDAIKGIKPTLDQARTDLATANDNLVSIKRLTDDSNIPATISNVQSMTKSGASILQDGADETRKLVHPDKVKLGFWGTANAVVIYLKHFIPPLF